MQKVGNPDATHGVCVLRRDADGIPLKVPLDLRGIVDLDDSVPSV